MAHVLNRGNDRATVFHTASEYQGFITLLAEACQRHPVDLLAFCLMPNHFHLVARMAAARFFTRPPSLRSTPMPPPRPRAISASTN